MIGLFFGDTEFPKLILNSIKKKKKNYFIIDLSKNNIFKNDSNSYRISIGQFGKILKLIKGKKCKKVIFAGKINKPKFSQLKLDMTGIYYIPRIVKASKKGDSAILKELIKILSIEKIILEPPSANNKLSSLLLSFFNSIVAPFADKIQHSAKAIAKPPSLIS